MGLILTVAAYTSLRIIYDELIPTVGIFNQQLCQIFNKDFLVTWPLLCTASIFFELNSIQILITAYNYVYYCCMLSICLTSTSFFFSL